MSNRIHTTEFATALHGVSGRMFNKVINGATGVFLNQKFSAMRALPASIKGFKKGSHISVDIRFDDQCKNGQQSFSITGSITEPGYRDSSECGCIHERIAVAFPELAHLIKWHLFDTRGPMHYVANTVYLASDRDHHGKRAGEPWAWDTHAKFGDFPITSKVSEKFAAFIADRIAINAAPEWLPVAVGHKGDGSHNYSPNYTIDGYAAEWHTCPFNSYTKAAQFCEALAAFPVEFIKVPTQFSEGKLRDFKAARSCAAWPDATDEELSVPPEELKAALLARAPNLLAAFRADMDAIGMLWEQAPDATNGATEGGK